MEMEEGADGTAPAAPGEAREGAGRPKAASESSAESMASSAGAVEDDGAQDPRRALRAELQQRRPSVYRVRKICRHGLGCRIPGDLRADIWQLLLGVDSKDRFLLDDSIRDTAQDLDNQRVIRVDAQRTRADVPAFRTPEMELLVSRLLTFYCKRKSIKYKQGLNEVLAPFIMLRDPPLPDGTIFNLLYAFIDKFLPHTYVHEEFHALQCNFRLFRLLLLYHDPELCTRLDTHNLAPELYATPWFLTMFARNVPLEVLYELWDRYLLADNNDGAVLNMFVALALMLENREGLLETHPSDLPIFVTSVLGPTHPTVGTGGTACDLPPTSSPVRCLVESMQLILKKAEQLRKATPKALEESLMRAVFFRQCPGFDVVERLEGQPCLGISPGQLLQELASDSRTRSADMLLRVVDCRSKEHFEDRHLVGALHMGPGLLQLPELLDEAFKELRERCALDCEAVSMHLVFVGNAAVPDTVSPQSAGPGASAPDEDCTLYVLHAIQRGFARVSYVEGGWQAVKRAARAEDVFEHGPAMDVLVEAPRRRSSSSTLSSLKDAMRMEALRGAMARSGSGDSLKEAASRGSKSPDSAGDRASANWIQRLGKSIGEAPSAWGGLFASHSSGAGAESIAAEPGSTATSIPPALAVAVVAAAPPPASASAPLLGTPGSTSLMSRMVQRVRTIGTSAAELGEAPPILAPPSPVEVEGNSPGAASNASPDDPDHNWVDLSSWLQPSAHGRDKLELFRARTYEMLGGAQAPQQGERRILCVSSGYVMCLRAHPDRDNFARIEEKYLIADLLKITSKKSVRDLVVFHFKGPGSRKRSAALQRAFVVERSRECIDLVKCNYGKQQRQHQCS